MEKIEKKPLYFYVANLGSEIQRFLVWQEKGDEEAMKGAYNRVVSIIEKIKEYGNKNANLEMNILQKNLKGEILSRKQISSYFNPFALRVIRSLA